jgi:hypothetical protein
MELYFCTIIGGNGSEEKKLLEINTDEIRNKGMPVLSEKSSVVAV